MAYGAASRATIGHREATPSCPVVPISLAICSVAAGLSALAFGAVPFGIRTALGGGLTGLAAGVAAGCLVQALGLWRFRNVLRLSAMPGVSSIQSRLHRARNR